MRFEGQSILITVAASGIGLITYPSLGVGPQAPQVAALAASPDPAREFVAFRAGGTALRVEILDLAGRRLRVLESHTGDAGPLRWDLRDASGRRVAPGVHFAIASRQGQVFARTRFVVVR